MSTSIQSSRACISAICRTSSGTWSIRARATAGRRFPQCISRVSDLFQSVAVVAFSDVISAAHSLGSEVLRLAIEATRTLKPLASRIFRRGPLLICNGGLHPTTAGRFSISRFLCALRVLQDFTRQGTDLLHFTPSAEPLCLGLVALCDGHTVERKERACPTRDGSNPA